MRHDILTPQVEFQSPDGKPVRFRSKLGRHPAAYQIEVFYNPQHPQDAIINVNPGLWRHLIVTGVVLAAFALLLLPVLEFIARLAGWQTADRARV
ncbi:MAG: DUF3592 domain-containing protein [Roseiflexus sp.]